MSVVFTHAIQVYIGTAWVDVTEDKLNIPAVEITRGIPGTEPGDRVADVGTMDWGMDNSIGNLGTALGYYSPDHANAMVGYDIGTKVRFAITYDGTAYYKFYGKIASLIPAFGQYRERIVSCQAVDYMNEFLVHNMSLVSVQSDKKGNELLGTIVANLPTAPLETSYATGPDIFPYALHDIQDENTSGMTAVQNVDNSGLSYTFVKGDLTGGETLVWQTRHTRALSASVATFTDTMTGLTISRNTQKIYGTVKGKGYPAQVGTSDEVLWTSRREIVLGAGASQTFDIPYTDPSGAGARVALSPGTGVTPVVTTDYKMSSTSGSGTDLNASLTYTVNTWGGNTANVTITNASAVTGYIWFMQLRGRIIRLNDPITVTKTDTTSKETYGDKTLTHNMPYQASVNVVDAFAADLLAKKKDPHSDIESMEFVANSSAALMAAAMAIDIGSRITVNETVTGLATDFFVNKYSLTIENEKLICRLDALESLGSTGTIGIWGTSASDSTFWGAGTATIGNWIF